MIEINTSPAGNVLPPPVERHTVLGWIYKNLFSSWLNALLTVAALALVYAFGRAIIGWALTKARWDVVSVNIRLLMVGQYPVTELWRIWLCLHLLVVVVGLSWGVWVHRYRLLGLVLAAAPIFLSTAIADAAARVHLVVVSALGIVGFGLSHKISTLKTEISALQQKKASYQPILNEIAKLKRNKETLEKKVDVIKKLKQGSQLTVRILDEIANRTPTSRLWLKSLKEAGGKLQLTGVAILLGSILETNFILRFFGGN